MAKRPKKPELHSWAIYRFTGTPAKLVGIIDNQPDADAAIKQAIEEFGIDPRFRSRLVAQRQD
jgi:hypothetical protein